MRSHIYCATLKHMVPPCHTWDSTFHTSQPLWPADTGIPWQPHPADTHPLGSRHCHGWCLLHPAETCVGTVAPWEVPVCPQSQEHFILVSPKLIEILTYRHCHCIGGFGRKSSKSTAVAVAPFYWHGHT